jgi:Amt family ammonium transporter
VDFLKIDGSFVRRIADDPVDLAMVQAINSLGHAMGLRTIAEFVENERVLEKLRALGVDFGQGHHIGLPLPLCRQPLAQMAA